jgi:PAS domain-containing protein
VPRTPRKVSSPKVRPAESDAARLANQRTEESLMDHALESEKRFRSIYENTIDGILLTAPDGCILAANPEACRLLGRTEQEIRAAAMPGSSIQAIPSCPPCCGTARPPATCAAS